jgi:hypothetical protein
MGAKWIAVDMAQIPPKWTEAIWIIAESYIAEQLGEH